MGLGSGARLLLIVGVATCLAVVVGELRPVPEVEEVSTLNERFVLAVAGGPDGVHALVSDAGDVVAGRFGHDGRFVPIGTVDLAVSLAAGTSTGFAASEGDGQMVVLDANGEVLHRVVLPWPRGPAVVDVWLMWSEGDEVLAAGVVADAPNRSGLWVSRDGGFTWVLSISQEGHPGAATWTGEHWIVGWNEASEGVGLGVVEESTWRPIDSGPLFLERVIAASFAPTEGQLLLTDGRSLGARDLGGGWVDLGQPFGDADVEVRVLDYVDGVWVAAGFRSSWEHGGGLGVTWTSENGRVWIESDSLGVPSGSYLHLVGRAATGAGYYLGEWPVLTNAW